MPVEHFVGNGAGFRYFCLWLPPSSLLYSQSWEVQEATSEVAPDLSVSILNTDTVLSMQRSQKGQILSASEARRPSFSEG